MHFQLLFKTSRQVVIELINEGIYETEEYEIYLNDTLLEKSDKIIHTIYNLKPATSYDLYISKGDKKSDRISFSTEKEYVTLNVKSFGAKGDGVQNDTLFIQTAINACPMGSRVLIPVGIYKVTSLFLKSNLILEFEEGATLSAIPDREQIPILPGLIENYDETEEYNLGTWEGNPLDMFASIINGINVSNVVICGKGIIDGNASKDNWWKNPKVMNKAFRPRTIYLNHCTDITIQGVTVQNSPSWCIHPYFSNRLKFIDLKVLNPKDSPNTDGLDPESCEDVEIIGVYFSLGDDCIAIKSGKIYMGAKFKTPSKNITIRQCYMKDGHGSVTVGSEMAGGVQNISVTQCKFSHTDRGLRIKTRRGRGKDGLLDEILFDNIIMDNVKTPFVINSFYYCDPDGHSEYVKTKEMLPVDERTPIIGSLTFQNITCKNCHVAGIFIYGLPEKKIKQVIMKNINIDFTNNPEPGVPAMMDGIEDMTRLGIQAMNIEKLEMNHVVIAGYDGKGIIYSDIDELILDEVTKELLTDRK